MVPAYDKLFLDMAAIVSFITHVFCNETPSILSSVGGVYLLSP